MTSGAASLNCESANFVPLQLFASVALCSRAWTNPSPRSIDTISHFTSCVARRRSYKVLQRAAARARSRKVRVKTIRFDRVSRSRAMRHSRARRKSVRSSVIPIESPAMAGPFAWRVPTLDCSDDGRFVGRRKYQFVPHPQRSSLDPARDDPALVEAINILNAKAQWQIDVALLRLQQIECFENVGRAIPFHFHTRSRDVLAFLGRRRNECPRVQAKLAKKLPIFLLDLAKSLLRVVRRDPSCSRRPRYLPDAEHAQQISVPPALLAHAFVRGDDQDRRIRARRAGDHVLQKFLVPWRIDDDVMAPRCSKRNLRRIDRDVLLLLFEKRIEQKSDIRTASLLPRRPFACSILPSGSEPVS